LREAAQLAGVALRHGFGGEEEGVGVVIVTEGVILLAVLGARLP